MVCRDKKWTLFPECELWFMWLPSPSPKPIRKHLHYTFSWNSIVHHIVLHCQSAPEITSKVVVFMCTKTSQKQLLLFFIFICWGSRKIYLSVFLFKSAAFHVRKGKNMLHIWKLRFKFCCWQEFFYQTVTNSHESKICLTTGSAWSFCPSIPSWVTGRQKIWGHITHS